MKRATNAKMLTTILTAAALALAVAPSLAGAEAFKLRHLATVYADEKGGMIKDPEGVACSTKGLIVADTGNGRLIRYSFQEGNAKGGAEIRSTEISYPIRVQLTSKDEILALDGKTRRIARFSAGGDYAGLLALEGVPAPAITPRSFKVDTQDNIHILDLGGGRVVTLDPAGKFLRQIPLPGTAGNYSDLAVSGGGDIYLLDGANARLFVAGNDAKAFVPLGKELREYLDFPTYVSVNNKGTIFVVDHTGSAIITLGLDGSFQGRQLNLGWKNALVFYPSQICMADNSFVIADRNNSRVQIFEGK